MKCLVLFSQPTTSHEFRAISYGQCSPQPTRVFTRVRDLLIAPRLVLCFGERDVMKKFINFLSHVRNPVVEIAKDNRLLFQKKTILQPRALFDF